MNIPMICPTHRPQLQLGSQGQAVEDLQQAINHRLERLSITSEQVARLTLDGDYGAQTHRAVQYLQCLSFLSVDGIAGAHTWTALCEGSSSLPILSHGSNGSLVSEVQTLFKAFGYYRGSVDGGFGALTQVAVQLYQAGRNLPVDGIIRPPTWEKISRDRSNHTPQCFTQIYGSGSVE